MDSSPPCLSFIGIVDFSPEARWVYMTDSVTDLLGYEPHELVGKPSLRLVHPDEFPRVKQLHYDTIQQDKAAVLVYLRMRHKDPYKGYILCGIVSAILFGIFLRSFASPGAKAMHNASTAQEITVLTPSARNFEFRRWNDPSPLPPSPVHRSAPLPASPVAQTSPWNSPSPPGSSEPTPEPHSPGDFESLGKQSFRTAFILDRFSVNCTVAYCSNDFLISTTSAIGRSFFDFVSKKDEDIVRSWIDVIKGWGVNERGQPSDGGFGFGRFVLLPEGRDSVTRIPEPTPPRHRQGSTTSKARQHRVDKRPNPAKRGNPSSPTDPIGPQISVDAIFSAHSDGLMVILRRAP
ncbi:hypothetical protein BD779DRAFT_1609090 [Infundibulicybe gibba]|nr:hypothetical protein BD779DRAFT_1609090 [Infundibulicybe gibba]